MRVIIYNGNQSPTTFVNALAVGLAKQLDYVAMAGKNDRISTRIVNGVYRLSTGSNSKLIQIALFIKYYLIIGSKKRLSILHVLHDYSISEKIRLFTLYASLLKQNPDIVHIQWANSISLFRPILKNHCNWFKIIVSFRGYLNNITPFVNEKVKIEFSELLPLADGYHAVSQNILNNATTLGIDVSKSAIVYPAVQDDLLQKTLDRHSNEKLQILSVGRDHWKKGYRVAIDAMYKLKAEGIKFHYTIVAGGEKEELRHQIHDLHLENEVTLIDNLPHAKVFEQHAKSNLFLLPSFEEGVANVALEAMALGTPVISTNCGGMQEVIENGVNGYIVPLRRVDAIVCAVKEYMKLTPIQKRDIIANARDTIATKHVISEQINQMIKLYNKTLNA